MKVVVFPPDGDGDLLIGIGDMHREDVPVIDDDDDSKILYVLKDHPVIVMEETGDIYCGIECWWIPVGDFVTTNQICLREFGRIDE